MMGSWWLAEEDEEGESELEEEVSWCRREGENWGGVDCQSGSCSSVRSW